MELLNEFLRKNRENSVKITVIGDAMIDEYYNVKVSRLSPEFPIPVMLSESSSPDAALPGGAANVAFQFKNFNVDVEICSILNNYAFDVMTANNLNVKSSVVCSYADVPIKRRLYDDDFPTYRWDTEKKNYGLSESKSEDLKNLFSKTNPDVVIFSDYGKGVFEKDGLDFFSTDAITIVDPKDGDISKWKGCTVFKPNYLEAKRLSGYSNWQDQCDYFMSELGCKYVVITSGGDGVYGGEANDYFFYTKPQVKAQSVIGAGDCFVSFLAMALARGFNIYDASVIAYEAGAIYVTRKHNKPIEVCDLSPYGNKFPSIDFLKSRDNLVFTNGCFDILHTGHLSTLRFAKSKGSELVVAVNSDESVRRLKGDSRPINHICERMEIIASLDMVDYVISFDEDDPEELIKKIRPKVLVKGGDYTADNVIGKQYVEEVFIAPTVPNKSSSKIIQSFAG